jgi:sporulation protein YlmC with PRC-barrel domain
MKRIVAATVVMLGTIVPVMAQQTGGSGPAQILTTAPAGKTIANYSKQNVYDPSNTKIGSIDDIIVNDGGQITAFLIGVGGFLGAGEKDVAVAFNAVHATMKDGSWYLTLNTTKDALKSAPGLTYDKTKTAWVPAAK